MGGRDVLEELGSGIKERFDTEKRVLSFEEYLDEFLAHPWRHSRDAPRYMRDCLDHFGDYEIDTPFGPRRRYRLFDQEFVGDAAEAARQRLVGQEQLQAGLYEALTTFVQEGRGNRLLMLHGPNGSAKSTFAACLMRALEHYSGTEEGALYRFSWVFPTGHDDKSIGFGAKPKRVGSQGSFAHLHPDRIRARLRSRLREHPLLLLPLQERRKLLTDAYASHGIREAPPMMLLHGRMAHQNAQVHEALLAAYGGDVREVLAHVQVERSYLSRRYRAGAVTIGPQMAVDASERQLTSDRTLAHLPAALSGVDLFESFGDLVDGACGVIEYSDLLKRPLDAWKYLLMAIETGEVALPFSLLPINAVLIASTNETHLAAFREHHEYNSFRARLSLLRAGYLLDYRAEQQIYDAQVVPHVPGEVAPHATEVAALWAVLTRLRRSSADHYEDAELGKLAADLSALEKAQLYSEGRVPERFVGDDGKRLRADAGLVAEEFQHLFPYEGIGGASPREMRTLLLNAAQRGDCLTPLSVIDQIEQLCEQGDYEFLREKPDGGFRDPVAFVGQVRSRWLETFDDEVRKSTGLVEAREHERMFERYVNHVSLWVKGERYPDPVTGELFEPDEALMERVESTLGIDDAEAFRHSIIGTIAAHAIDHPDAEMNQAEIFRHHMARLQTAYFAEHRAEVGAIVSDMVGLLTEEDRGLSAEAEKHARETLDRLRTDHGYCDTCLGELLGVLLQEHYAQ